MVLTKLEKQTKHRKEFPDIWRAYSTFRRANIIQKIRLIKAKTGCEECGYPDPIVLHFHHKNPKTKSFTIGQNVTAKSWKSILKEIKKCNVLCANCHLLHHYNNASKK